MENNNPIWVLRYGSLANDEVFGRVIGGNSVVGHKVKVPDYELRAQKLEQVPNVVFSKAPVPLSPQELLRESWDEGFESYGPQHKEGASMDGIISEITSEEAEFLAEWELEPFGWYEKRMVKVVTPDGKTKAVQALVFGDNQETEREVIGDYPVFPGNVTKERYFQVLEKAKGEFLERKVASKEGTLVGVEASGERKE